MEHQVIRLQIQEKEIIMIPTAHVSKDSAEYVKEVIEQENPDSICIELDEDRYQSLKNPKKWEETDLVDVIKKGKAGYLFVNLVLSNYQKKLAKHLGSRSGQEMVYGMEASELRNIPLVLADRSIQTTFTRIWRKQSLWDKCKLITTILSTLFDDEEFSEEDLLQLQQQDMLSSALEDVQKAFPKISEVLVHERDQYLAYKIKHAPGKKVIAILGAAHTIGIQEEIHKEYALEPLCEIPPKGKLGRIVLWAIPILLIVAVLFTLQVNKATGISQILSWVIWNGTLSAFGCLLCAAHPFTIVISFIAAPITSLSPMLAAGWFAGLCEAMIRKPQVKDFEEVTDALGSVRNMRKNHITKILLIVILANIGSSIGTLIGGADIVQKFISVAFG